MKVKGIKKLNKAVKKTLAPFGVKKVSLSDDYRYYPHSRKIEYSLYEGTPADEAFNDFIEEEFNYIVPNTFMISILHEVGHFFTYNTTHNTFCDDEKERIEKELTKLAEGDVEGFKTLNYEYFNLPDEYAATAWAVNYMREHPKKIKEMYKKIEKALIKFYIKNKVEG